MDREPSALLDKERKALRARGHHLKPVVLVGKEGLTEQVIGAVDSALTAHELVKVKLLKSCATDKDEAAALVAERTGAALVQRLGRTALLYRPRPEEEEARDGQ